jgi:Domain of unknown function (DUF6968)
MPGVSQQHTSDMRLAFEDYRFRLWIHGTIETPVKTRWGTPMYLDEIEEIIATRRLYVTGTTEEIIVVLGKPKRSTDSLGYYCPYRIEGIGSEHIKYAKGLDEIQAIQEALFLIGVDLSYMNQSLGGKLRWEGDDRGGLGFHDANRTE